MVTAARILLLLATLLFLLVQWRRRRLPSGRLLFVLLMGMMAVGAALAWFGAGRALRGTYYPAVLAPGGTVTQGHGGAP